MAGMSQEMMDELARRETAHDVYTSPEEAFGRVRGAYDLNLLRASRVVLVGLGGAASFAEDLARAGVGQFVLVDGDTVSLTNLGTQQVYRRDVGRFKVDCVAERILDINPSAVVRCVRAPLDDAIDDEGVRAWLFDGIDGHPSVEASQSLVCGLTDSFIAQARVARIALKFGVPSLLAQVYFEGRGAEVTFTHPKLSRACHRCMLSSRYDAFLGGGFVNNVTSHGTPIFATTRLNAVKGFVATALLHADSDHDRFAGLLRRIANNNLVLVRLDPLISALGVTQFDRVFEGADQSSLVFDESLWRPQVPDHPRNGATRTCPDCGGMGDLRAAMATIEDTRTILS